MLDLKNCPFCGGKATFAKTTKGWKVECEGRWGTCTINARTHYQPTKGQAVDAWNRRALQAVGPEPAVAGVETCKFYHSQWPVEDRLKARGPYGLITDDGEAWRYEYTHSDADGGPYDVVCRPRSALLATPPRPCTCHPDDNPPTPCAEKYALGDCRPTPPAEPVVEAPQPANSVRGAAERVVSFDWSSNDPDAVAAVDALRAALATKPAVKDDETVVALPPTREYVDRIVRIFRDRPADDTSAVVLHDYARAALSGSGSGWPVPDGWKLVPVEPDDAMIEAGQDTCEEKNCWGGRVYASDIWESMLAASPAAPQQGGE